jgi:apolipoprotein N-acyltransferase
VEAPESAAARLRVLGPGALALVAGVVVALALPPWGFWPLAFVGVALFEVALGEAPTRRQGARRAFLFALAWTGVGMCWMWFLTPPGYVFSFCLFCSARSMRSPARWRPPAAGA